jgi:hypothetical protein
MKAFENRVLLNWINDISSVPKYGKRWPIIDMDEQLVKDYKQYLEVAHEWGYNGFTIWGLFINHSWPLDLKSCLDSRRKRFIREIIDYAHKKDIRIYTGLGVYSWGFEEIIRKHPDVKSSDQRKVWGRIEENNQAMCYHKEEAHEWMRKIIDFIAAETDIDGFGMQAADMGRCICDRCITMEDTEYYAVVSSETAGYIKDRWPEKLVAVSGWGMSFDRKEDLPILKKLSGRVDYITDVTQSAVSRGLDSRRKLINELSCNFGTVGGVVVTPPHTWDRLRWFLPHLKVNGTNLKELAADGGKAFEYFTGPIANPGEEVTLKAIGYMLKNPESDLVSAMEAATDSSFGPTCRRACSDIASLMMESEEAYFSNIPFEGYGELDFEPLMAEAPGEPIYIQGKPKEQLIKYKDELLRIQKSFAGLKNNVKDTQKMDTVVNAIENVINEIEAVGC